MVLMARSAEEIETVAESIRAAGGKATAVPLDVTDIAAVDAFFGSEAAFNILVNNAGTNRPKPMWDVSEADYDAVLDLNLKSLYFVTAACTRQMIALKAQGSIIHVGSQMGHVVRKIAPSTVHPNGHWKG